MLFLRRCFRLYARNFCTGAKSSSVGFCDSVLHDTHLLPKKGHRVLIIQPEISRPASGNRAKSVISANGPNTDEAVALIDSLGDWKVIDFLSVKLRGPLLNNRERFFTKGIWDNVSQMVHQYRTGQLELASSSLAHEDGSLEASNADDSNTELVTAVFVNWPRLSALQLAAMQNAWHLPVYDRYTVVVLLFSVKARTREARLHAQLAELALIRTRLPLYRSQYTAAEVILGGAQLDNAATSNPHDVLKLKEDKLLAELRSLEQQRQLLREQRRQKENQCPPTVSVVGYTNAGKTSLIRCLSGKLSLHASSQVFTTLDVTHHRVRLPNVPDSAATESHGIGIPGVHTILLDTIGFMSDLPTNLFPAFCATLGECRETDLILHIVDVTVPDWEERIVHVDTILEKAGLCLQRKSHLPGSPSTEKGTRTQSDDSGIPVLYIGNKVDRGLMYISETNSCKLDVLISTKSSTGIGLLTEQIKSELMKSLGWFTRTISIDQGSDSLRWLYSNTMVTNVVASPGNPEKLHVSAIFTPASWSRLLKRYRVTA